MPKYNGELFLLKKGLIEVSKSSNKAFLSLAGRFLTSKYKGKRTVANLITKYNSEFEVTPTGRDFAICLDPVDDSHHVIYQEIFVDKIYDLSKLSFTPDVVIDCGAHIGLFTVLANKAFPGKASFAFEPNEENIVYLKKNCQRNNLSTEIIPAAVSDYDGTCAFRFSFSYAGALDKNREDPSPDVMVVNLIEFIKKWHISKMLLKMDIEGEEETLLPKLLEHLPVRTSLYFETHHGLDKFNQLAKQLEAFGFSVEIVRIRDLYIDAFAQR